MNRAQHYVTSVFFVIWLGQCAMLANVPVSEGYEWRNIPVRVNHSLSHISAYTPWEEKRSFADTIQIAVTPDSIILSGLVYGEFAGFHRVALQRVMPVETSEGGKNQGSALTSGQLQGKASKIYLAYDRGGSEKLPWCEAGCIEVINGQPTVRGTRGIDSVDLSFTSKPDADGALSGELRVVWNSDESSFQGSYVFKEQSLTAVSWQTPSEAFVLAYASERTPEVVDGYEKAFRQGRLFDAPAVLITKDYFLKPGYQLSAVRLSAAIVSRVGGDKCVVTTLEPTLEQMPYHDPKHQALAYRTSWLWTNKGSCTHYLTEKGTISVSKMCGNAYCTVTRAFDELTRLNADKKLDAATAKIVASGQLPLKYAAKDVKTKNHTWIGCQNIEPLAEALVVAKTIWNDLIDHEQTQRLLLKGAPEIYSVRTIDGDELEPYSIYKTADPYYLESLPAPNVGNPIELSRQLFFHCAQAGGAAATMQEVLDEYESTYSSYVGAAAENRTSAREQRRVEQAGRLAAAMQQRDSLMAVIHRASARIDSLNKAVSAVNSYRGKTFVEWARLSGSIGDGASTESTKHQQPVNVASLGVLKDLYVADSAPKVYEGVPNEHFSSVDGRFLIEGGKVVANSVDGFGSRMIFEHDLRTKLSISEAEYQLMQKLYKDSSSVGMSRAPLQSIRFVRAKVHEAFGEVLGVLDNRLCSLVMCTDERSQLMSLQKATAVTLAQPSDSLVVVTRSYADSNYVQLAYDAARYEGNGKIRQSSPAEIAEEVADLLEDLADEDHVTRGSRKLLSMFYQRKINEKSDLAVGNDLEDFNEEYLDLLVQRSGADDLENYLEQQVASGFRPETDRTEVWPLFRLDTRELDERTQPLFDRLHQMLNTSLVAATKQLSAAQIEHQRAEQNYTAIAADIEEKQRQQEGVEYVLTRKWNTYRFGIEWLLSGPPIMDMQHWVRPVQSLETNIVTPILDDMPSDMKEYMLSSGTARSYVQQPNVALSVIQHPLLVPAWESLKIRQHFNGSEVEYHFVVDVRRGNELYGCYNYLTELTHCPIEYAPYDQGLSRQYRFQFRWNPSTNAAEVSRVDHLFPMK